MIGRFILHLSQMKIAIVELPRVSNHLGMIYLVYTEMLGLK